VSLIRRALGQESRGAFLYGNSDPYGNYGGYSGVGVPPPTWMPETSSGAVVTDHTALQLSAFYASVRLLADTVASLPWDSFRNNDEAKLKVNPAPSLLRDPHPDMTIFDWKHVMVVSLAIRGNFFGLVTDRDALGYPAQVLPLHPDWVVLHRDPATGAKTFFVNGEKYDPADILHIRWFTFPGSDLGLSPVAVFRQSIGLGLAAEDFGGKWFRDGAAPSSVLETDATLTDDQIKQTQQQWVATHGGRRRPAVLSGGFKWQPITISPEESQFLETRKFQVSEVARMFGIPPHMIGDVDRSTSWGTGIEQMSVGFLRFTLMPWLERIEAALNRITPRSQYVKFDVKQLLRGDVVSRTTAFKTAIDAGYMNPDEARAEEDMPPIPGGLGQNFRQPLNFGPLGWTPNDNDIKSGEAPPSQSSTTP
jgi:HK97 family phage portal protein